MIMMKLRKAGRDGIILLKKKGKSKMKLNKNVTKESSMKRSAKRWKMSGKNKQSSVN